VFLSAILKRGEEGKDVRNYLKRIQDGELQGATSALTYDEIFWITKKYRSFERALIASKAFLEMPNLTILPVDADVLWRAHKLSAKYKLHPRDAIHAACALMNNITTIISEDEDFDRVKGLERRSL